MLEVGLFQHLVEMVDAEGIGKLLDGFVKSAVDVHEDGAQSKVDHGGMESQGNVHFESVGQSEDLDLGEARKA